MKTDKGFTLVELAVVMTIVGLLIGSVLKGQEMVNNARVTSVINEVQSYIAAKTAFRDKYSQLPGDMSTATARLTGCSGLVPAGNWCGNGNGNNLVGQPSIDGGINQSGTLMQPQVETTLFWTHLSLADLISGISVGDPQDPAWGVTHPDSAFGGGFHIQQKDDNDGGIDDGWGLQLRLQGNIMADALDNKFPILSPVRARQIDTKMDDGMPNTGYVQADLGSTQCDTGDLATDTYTLSTDIRCILYFMIDG